MTSNVKRFFEEGYGIKATNPSPFIKQHRKNKSKLAEMLGGVGKVEYEIDLEVDNDRFSRLIHTFLEKYPSLEKAVKDFTKQEIINNKNLTNKNFQKGMKLSKILSKLYEENPNQMLIDYSMLIQDSRTVGTLVITTDLMEMLTCSMNSKGWSSCLDLDKGAYRAGIYSYALDNTTILAYLKSSKTKINGVEVDDKRWRQFIHINLDKCQAIFSKNYPYQSPELSIIVREKLEELLSSYKELENR